MPSEYTESERPALDTLQQLGWEVVNQQRTTCDEEKAEIQKRYAKECDLSEAESRIEEVALDIVEHFENEIARPFNGMVVTTGKRTAV